MALRRIFSDVGLRSGSEAVLRGDAANHVLRVLRLRTGDDLVVFDGSGRDHAARVSALGRDEVRVAVGDATEVPSESPLAVTLMQGVCRGPRMDTVIQKATELGVAKIMPVLAGRSVVRLDDEGASRKREHWRRVAIAAAEQSGRSRIPAVSAPVHIDEAVTTAAGVTRVLLDPGGRPIGTLGALPAEVTLLVGPEGGLTEDERDLALRSGFAAIRLGPRILRTETAPLAALALLQYLAGDLGR